MTCKDCIHENVCSALIKDGLPWEDGKYPAEAFCLAFRNKADVLEVVRCKDCVHHDDCICVVCEEGETVVCKKESRHVRKDFSCIYGAKMEEHNAKR